MTEVILLQISIWKTRSGRVEQVKQAGHNEHSSKNLYLVQQEEKEDSLFIDQLAVRKALVRPVYVLSLPAVELVGQS